MSPHTAKEDLLRQALGAAKEALMHYVEQVELEGKSAGYGRGVIKFITQTLEMTKED